MLLKTLLEAMNVDKSYSGFDIIIIADYNSGRKYYSGRYKDIPDEFLLNRHNSYGGWEVVEMHREKDLDTINGTKSIYKAPYCILI